jgi:hypothetical protein
VKYNIIYFGKDEVFLNSLQKGISTHENSEEISLTQMKFHDNEDDNLTTKLVHEMISKNPDVIMIDFSYKTENMLMLARHLRMTLDAEKISFIGLLNQVGLEDKTATKKNGEQVKLEFLKASLTQIPIIHFKGVDIQHLLFDALYMKDEDKSFRMTTAKFKTPPLEIKAKYFSTITHFLPKHLILETSLKLAKGARIQIQSNFQNLLDRKFVEVEDSCTQLLQTKYNNRYRLSLNFQPPAKESEEDPQEGEETKKEERLPEVDTEALELFVKTLDRKGADKNVKLLLVQEGLDVLRQLTESLSSLPYLIRYQTGFRRNMKIVRNFRPNLIAVEMSEQKAQTGEEENKEENDSRAINYSAIGTLISEITSIDGYKPIIKLFNSTVAVERIREELGYPFIISSTEEMSLQLLLDMLEIYSKKQSNVEKDSNDPMIKSGESAYNIYALNPVSGIKFGLLVEMTSITEHEITFLCPFELPVRAVLVVTVDGVKFYVTVLNPPEQLENVKGKNHYFGVINGITTMETQELRQVINNLFLMEKRKKEEEEREKFHAANRDAAAKKANAETEAKEEAELHAKAVDIVEKKPQKK